MDKTVDADSALDRLRSYPPRMLRVDDVYFILFGAKAPKTIVERTVQSLRSIYDSVTNPFHIAYYRCRALLRAYFTDGDEMISTEDAPPGSKAGEFLMSTGGIELFLRRNRKVIYHPSLGIEIATLELPATGEDRYRISPADVARYLRGEPAVEYETGSLNLLNSSRMGADNLPEAE